MTQRKSRDLALEKVLQAMLPEIGRVYVSGKEGNVCGVDVGIIVIATSRNDYDKVEDALNNLDRYPEGNDIRKIIGKLGVEVQLNVRPPAFQIKALMAA